MKSKTLLNIAVASTLGLSVAAFAGPGHNKWVAAGDAQYPGMIFGTEAPRGIAGLEVARVMVIEPVGVTSSSFEGAVGGTYLSMDESLARANEGIYSDFILTSVPVTFESWDVYVLD